MSMRNWAIGIALTTGIAGAAVAADLPNLG
jgi:hypothetical protein